MTEDQQITVVVFGALVALTAIAWLWCSVVLVARVARARTLERARGEVVGHERRVTRMSSSTGGDTAHELFAAVVRFDVDGATRTVTSPVASNVPPAIGTTLVVAWPRGRPEEAAVDSALSRYFAPAVVWLAMSVLAPVLGSVGVSAFLR